MTMDLSKFNVKDILVAFIDLLIKMLKGLGVIETEEELAKSDAYKESIDNLINAVSAAMED